MALDVSLDISFVNIKDWKGMRNKAGEADSAIY
jgi:hypothetical protein